MKQKSVPVTGKKQVSKKKENFIKKIKNLFTNIFKKTSTYGKNVRNFKFTKTRIFILSIVVFLIVVYLLKSLIFAAFVNGRPVFRLNVLNLAEKQSGSTILENLIEKKLILNEARKQNIKVSNEAIESEIANIEEVLKQQDITLEQALELSSQDIKSLKDQIKIQKIVEDILGDDISVEESEITEYFNENKEFFGANANLEEVKDQIGEELFNQKLSTAYSNWIQELKVNAKIKYLVNY